MLLALQVAALAWSQGLRVLASSACFVAVVAMFVFVRFIVSAGPGANIGAGLLLIAVPISLALLVAAVLQGRTGTDPDV